ncbi:NAD(P)H-dependent oxidoreductase [Halomonas caseinilytica]|uniref:NAD(P)H-dependent oxidoreductase n=1 Tax=Halomonas caseinilytica TaxID=438744 RepID=UPI0007E5A6FF|nr:NAD(P)H-dependent oxidoreductase [Halomonas caseinilytica]SEN40337.1 Putative NADPH-quinone reductase (modulator of drug activity B) [Halomonas caseinilytica]
MERLLVVNSAPDSCYLNNRIVTALRVIFRLASECDLRVLNLYAQNFSPVLTDYEHAEYRNPQANIDYVDQDQFLTQSLSDVKWANSMLIVFPVWWMGVPAILKGWLDRLFRPGLAFTVGREGPQPHLTGIQSINLIATFAYAENQLKELGIAPNDVIAAPFRMLCEHACPDAVLRQCSIFEARRFDPHKVDYQLHAFCKPLMKV